MRDADVRPESRADTGPPGGGAKDIGALFKQTFREWTEDRVPRLGAALAYYTALSIAPLLVISLRIVSLFFGTDAARAQLSIS